MIEVNNYLITANVQDILTELKSQLQINGVNRFATMKVSGNNLLTNCPFHKDGQERKPSFGILMSSRGDRKEGTCHCLACGWAGSLSELISGCFGYEDFGSYGEKWLVKNFLTIAVESRKDIDLDYDRQRILGTDNNSHSSSFVSESELDSYRYIHPYMYQRGLTDELIEKFDIGYDSSTKCITFPNKNTNGDVLFVARRSVNTKFFNYPMGVEKPVYGLYEILTYAPKPFNDIYICESMLDALAFWRVGKLAVALNGLGDEKQFKALREFPCRHYILATDCDERGLKARQLIKNRLYNKVVTEIFYPSGRKDANDCSDDELLFLKDTF